KLTPNPRASAGSLIRRLYYDLTGLPPTPEEVANFEKAAAADFDSAYDQLVETLLASPAYGEKWARHWLDVVRYAESNGFERDNSKPEIWKYRDYVINSLNADKPYDQFLIEQIAGDELSNPTRESLVATGYHRLMQWDDEPADRLQHKYDVLADNVLVTSETFLATTLNCSRCHDHKADPISAKDYYSFMAFFHGVTHYQTPGTIVRWADADEREAFEKVRSENMQRLTLKYDELETEIRDLLADEGLLKREQATTQAATFIRDGSAPNPAKWEYTTKRPSADWKDVGFRDKSWSRGFGGLGTEKTPNIKVNTRWDSPEIWARTSFGLKEVPKEIGLGIFHDEDIEVYLNGVEIFKAKGYTTDYKAVTLGETALRALQTGRNTIAVYCKQTSGGQGFDLTLKTVVTDSKSLTDLVRINGGKKLEAEINKLAGRSIWKELTDTKNQIEDWKKREAGEALNVVKENGHNTAPLHVHLRGSAHALGDPVVPAIPAVLGAEGHEPHAAEFEPANWAKGSSSGRRLALAQWMVSDSNPLTSRVMANRVWQHLFGRGITPSTSDFGTLGELPTHPELLDHLAISLKQNGWSLKNLQREILKSATYQMSSAPNSGNSQTDPNNDLFWRNNMRRLTAEELRDSILAVSGKLVEKQGGNWVYPPLPKEVLATASQPGKGWPISKNTEDHYRRSIYVHVKRSLRHQMLADFDQADTDSPCAVRFATTVPTQALNMLNSKFVNDQADLLAERLKEAGDDPKDRIKAGLSLTMQRVPSSSEIEECAKLVSRLQNELGIDAETALKRVALLALNLNEFVYLD
ncbi:MAG: DUF1549 and DUF1553 domain-containing protein, partial [Verrucomicrobiota bacterium]